MLVSIGNRPDHDFDEPLGLMSDCHRRIEHFLRVLLRVLDQSSGGELSDTQRQAMEVALRYFRQAAPRHTEDEELSLFPRMRRLEDETVQQALARLEALEADHRRAERAHDQVDWIGKQWLRDGRIGARMVDRLRQLLTDLAATYQRHIAIEDQEIFPMARRLLPAEELSRVGREMARRRQIAREL